MNIYHMNSNRQLLNSYLKYLSVIVSWYKPINLLVLKKHFG